MNGSTPGSAASPSPVTDGRSVFVFRRADTAADVAVHHGVDIAVCSKHMDGTGTCVGARGAGERGQPEDEGEKRQA